MAQVALLLLTMPMNKAAAALLALTLSVPAFAEELRVTIPGHDDLILDVPSSWHASVHQTQPTLPPTISVSPAHPPAAQLLITPAWPTGGATAPTSNDIRKLAQMAAATAQRRAVEPELKLRDLDASGKSGYYFSATDRQPEPNGFKYLTQGAIGLNELRITFTILDNEESKSATKTALELLRSMRRTAPAVK